MYNPCGNRAQLRGLFVVGGVCVKSLGVWSSIATHGEEGPSFYGAESAWKEQEVACGQEVVAEHSKFELDFRTSERSLSTIERSTFQTDAKLTDSSRHVKAEMQVSFVSCLACMPGRRL